MRYLILVFLILVGCSDSGSDPKEEIGGLNSVGFFLPLEVGNSWEYEGEQPKFLEKGVDWMADKIDSKSKETSYLYNNNNQNIGKQICYFKNSYEAFTIYKDSLYFGIKRNGKMTFYISMPKTFKSNGKYKMNLTTEAWDYIGIEKIEVPAGIFDCYVFKNWHGNKIYLAKNIGVIKLEYKDQSKVLSSYNIK